jgi:transcription initiation factor TFIID TATA-box-binding protein
MQAHAVGVDSDSDLDIKLNENDYAHLFEQYKQELTKEATKYQQLYDKYRLQYDDQFALPEIKVVNVVVSTNVESVDIEKVKSDLQTEWYPKQFPGFVHRLQNPKAAILLFKTGKLICTGIKTVEDAYLALEFFTKKFDCKLAKEEIKIQNLVISVDFRHYIDLEEAANCIPRAIYESEQFPGIIYRNVEPKAVFLIFTSGRCICVGTSQLENAFEAAFYIRSVLISNNLLIPKDK